MSNNNKPVAEALYRALVDSYALYLKAHNYHWNVTGAHFVSLHKLFQDIYEDLAVAVDEIAERIRSLGEKVPANFKVFDSVASIEDGNEHSSAQAMIMELAKDHRIVAETLAKALQVSQKAEDESSADILIQRLKTHDKFAWMLDSLIEK